MLNKIRELLTETPPQSEEKEHKRIRLATSVLLLDIACADDEFTANERVLILDILRRRFELDEEEAAELLNAAEELRTETNDLWRYTNRINEICTNEEKRQMLEEIWRVIYSDGRLDGHEDYLVHRLQKLLNLTHRDLINAKLKVRDEVR